MSALFRALTRQEAVDMQRAAGAPDITSQEMQHAIAGWLDMWFQRKPNDCEDPCQRLPYAIVSKLCKAVFCEYDSRLQDATGKLQYFDDARKRLDTIKTDIMQWSMVGGAALVKPIMTARGIEWRYIRRDGYIVLGRDADGALTDICTSEKTAKGKGWYTLIERRAATGNGLLVSNKLYFSDNAATLGRLVSLETLDKYKGLQEKYLFPGITGIGLAEIKMPVANCVDGSHDGISLLEPVQGLIHAINRNEYQLNREFELGRARVIASADMLHSTANGKKLDDDLFVGMEEDPSRVGLTIFAPELRNANYEQRRQAYLKAIENLLGIKRGILSDVEAAERTATEINTSAGDYAVSIMELQSLWYDTLQEALQLANQLLVLYGFCPEGTWKPEFLTVTWGNGVLYDADKEWAERRQMVADGLLKPELALAWKFDLPCETPKDLEKIREKYMPEMEELTP